MNSKPQELNATDASLVLQSYQQIPDVDKFIAKLYARLFELSPEVRNLFSTNMEIQQEKLQATLTTLVLASSNFESVVERLQALGRTHQEYGIVPEQYELLGEAIIWTLKNQLGDAFEERHEVAWTRFYRIVSDSMMVR